MAFAAIAAAVLPPAYGVGYTYESMNKRMNTPMNGPDRYAQQFSETDARIELVSWENELKQGGSPDAVRNMQSFVNALKKRLAEVTVKPTENHPTVEMPPEKKTAGGLLIDDIKNVTTTATAPVVKEVQHITGADIPLPPAAFHRDITEGPNPMAAFWELLRHTQWTHPLAVIEALWNVTVETFDYVIWDLKEFVRLITAWNGSVWMLTGHPQYLFDLIWRTLMTGLIVVGAVMSGPLLMVMTEWTKMVVEVLVTLGHWVADTVTYTSRRLRH